jgi:hypothetical protein
MTDLANRMMQQALDTEQVIESRWHMDSDLAGSVNQQQSAPG